MAAERQYAIVGVHIDDRPTATEFAVVGVQINETTVSGGGSLAAGTASLVSEGDTIATVEATDATGGTTPYTYQWQRSTSSGTGYSDVPGATSLTLNDTGLTNGVTYFYQLVYTDADTTSVTSNEVEANPTAAPATAKTNPHFLAFG